MQKNRLLALVGGLIMLASCAKTFEKSELRPSAQPNTNLLPVLEIKTDTSVYPPTAKNRKETDYRESDAKQLFTSEVNENIIEQTGVKKGYIVMRLSYEDTKAETLYKVIGFIACIPMALPIFLGAPYGAYTQDLEVEVQIQNNHRDIIKRYKAQSQDTEYVASWWAYTHNSAIRKAAAENLKKALQDIRYQINSDAPEIRAALK